MEKENSARSSFPSGHASQAAFGAIFLVLYAQVESFELNWYNQVKFSLKTVI